MKTFKQFLEQTKGDYYKIPGLSNDPIDSEVHVPSRPSWVNDFIKNDAKNKKNNNSFFYKFDVKSKTPIKNQ